MPSYSIFTNDNGHPATGQRFGVVVLVSEEWDANQGDSHVDGFHHTVQTAMRNEDRNCFGAFGYKKEFKYFLF
jgi:hypothetical protein